MKKYEDAFGVTAFEWKLGKPGNGEGYGLALVEVWTPKLSINWNAQRPQVEVHSAVQVWVHTEEGWKRLDNFGRLTAIAGEARRWARLPHSQWEQNITVGGWR